MEDSLHTERTEGKGWGVFATHNIDPKVVGSDTSFAISGQEHVKSLNAQIFSLSSDNDTKMCGFPETGN